MSEKTPEYCTFQCPHGDFPPADSAGLCRTMAAVYCKKLKKLIPKNTPCQWARPAAKARKPKHTKRRA